MKPKSSMTADNCDTMLLKSRGIVVPPEKPLVQIVRNKINKVLEEGNQE